MKRMNLGTCMPPVKIPSSYADAAQKLADFAEGASLSQMERVFPGFAASPGDCFFPVLVEPDKRYRKFIVRIAGEESASLCFSRAVFWGRKKHTDDLSNISELATCSQSSELSPSYQAARGVTGNIFGNNVHTEKETNPWWQAEIPSEFRVKYLFLYRRFDLHIANEANLQVIGVDDEGAETILYHPHGFDDTTRKQAASYLGGEFLTALTGLRGLLAPAEVPAFDRLVSDALTDSVTLLPSESGVDDARSDSRVGRQDDIAGKLLDALYMALGGGQDFGMSEEDGLDIRTPGTKARYLRFRAFGEAPTGLGGATLYKAGADEPAYALDAKALKFTYSRPAAASPDSLRAGLLTAIKARQVDLGEVKAFDRATFWNLSAQHAANTLFLEISVRASEDEEWTVVYDRGERYRHAVQILQFVNWVIKGRWTPSYGRVIGKLFTQYRRKALMAPVAKLTRGQKDVHDAVFEGSNAISNVIRFAAPLKLGKHGLGVPIAFRDTKTVMSHLVEMRDKIRSLGHTPMFMYGTLLGAIREKDFIPHDDDVDFAVILDGVGPEELSAACDKFVEELNANGVKAKRGHPVCPLIHCRRNPMTYDIFLLGRVGDTVYWPHAQLAIVPERVDIFLPAGAVDFKGEVFDAPADPEAVCEARYGSDWHIPNPAFEW